MKKIILIILVIVMFTGCSKTVSYKYNEVVSQNGDWSVEKNGQISVKEGDALVKFKVKYIGDQLINEGASWTCYVFACKNEKVSSIDNAEVIFTRIDIYGKEMTEGDTKVVSTERRAVSLENEYDFSTVYLKIEYTKDNEDNEDIIELSLKG